MFHVGFYDIIIQCIISVGLHEMRDYRMYGKALFRGLIFFRCVVFTLWCLQEKNLLKCFNTIVQVSISFRADGKNFKQGCLMPHSHQGLNMFKRCSFC